MILPTVPKKTDEFTEQFNTSEVLNYFRFQQFINNHFQSDVVPKVDNQTILGIGRYGTVFKRLWCEKSVAVKRIELAHVASNKQEEAALLKLHHPNIVKLFHFASDSYFR